MGRPNTILLTSNSAAETELLGEKIGRRLRGGEVIELVSDLGGGKTTFVRGLARGLGSADHVSSPTFKIANIYKAGKLELHHFDFYRLADSGIIDYELHDVINDPQTVSVIEWAEVVHHILPDNRLTIRFVSSGEEGRKLELGYSEAIKYLVEDL